MPYLNRFSWYGAAAGLLLLLTAGYSLFALTESPPTWYDEGLYIQVAQSLAERGTQSVQIAPEIFVSSGFITGGYPFLAPIALSIRVLGDTFFAARLPMVIFILLLAGVSWLLLRRIGGEREALLSLLLLSTLPILYGNGKNVLGEVPGLLYSVVFLYALHRIEERNFHGIGNYIFAGLSLGLAAAAKPVYLALPVAFALAYLLRVRSVPLRFKEISAGAISFLVPASLWLYLQFGAGDKAASTLSYYANPYAVGSFLETIVQNAQRFASEATPLYCGMLVAAWTLAIIVRLRRAEPVSFAESTAFIFSLIVLAAYLRTAGWYRYLFQTLALALIFFPHSLKVAASLLRGYIKPAALTVAVSVVLASFQFYQLNYSSWVAEHYQSRATAFLEENFSAYPREKSLFIYDAPEVAPFLRSSNFYQYILPNPAMSYGDLTLLERGVPDEVLVPAARRGEVESRLGRYKERGMIGSYIIYARVL